ncbi:LytR/AlgR family response regulator transcription factor [Anaerostipes sp.]|uniref:LytR/AlgR family response regulator transcription factor n=1 Tax=Anaerostipes sp. TaxID=1872530 RepID=UPI0025BB6A03|nr:LytTR family DNA-binding domain-containing protein [Anaerostipes sp.]MBS7007066.1 response regulator transcription factor [Anaerostipes sp.]
MRIAVCDDCMEDALSLKNYLEGHEVSLYSDGEGLLADVEGENRRYDLYLLDIFMDVSVKEAMDSSGDEAVNPAADAAVNPPMDGIELAKRLRRIQEDTPICFVSSSDDFYREAYDLYALQYLIKPVGEENLRELLRKVEKKHAKHSDGREKALVYSWWGKNGAIPYSEILYISSRGHVLSICCTDGRVQESVGKLGDLEEQLSGKDFLRCHQSFIVNMRHVRGFAGTELVLAAGGQKVPVSRRYYATVKKQYQELLFEEVE